MDDVDVNGREDLLAEARKRYGLCTDYYSDERQLAVDDLEFRKGKQWPEDIKAEREGEGRPCLVINRIPAFIRQIENDIRQISPSIKVRGVDSQSDPKTAEVINGMIRAIEGTSQAESAYDWAGMYAINCGFGYWKITTDYCDPLSFDQDILIKRIKNPFTVYLDPLRQEQDGSDARYGFIVDQVPKEEFEAKYPDVTSEWSGDGRDDYHDPWFSEETVRVAEYWRVETTSRTISQTPMGIVEGKVEGFPSRETEEKKVVQYLITVYCAYCTSVE